MCQVICSHSLWKYLAGQCLLCKELFLFSSFFFLPSFLFPSLPPFLPPFLPSFFPSFLLSFFSFFLPSFLGSTWLCTLPQQEWINLHFSSYVRSCLWKSELIGTTFSVPSNLILAFQPEARLASWLIVNHLTWLLVHPIPSSQLWGRAQE